VGRDDLQLAKRLSILQKYSELSETGQTSKIRKVVVFSDSGLNMLIVMRVFYRKGILLAIFHTFITIISLN